MIEDLSNAGRRGRLHDALETYTHPHVLVIDEVGYLTYGPEAANVPYHVVSDRHLRKRPMVFTTNKPLNAWGRVLHDPDLAAAILDRVLERGRWITLDGPSGRTKHLKLETTVTQDADGARVSGKQGPEFPEPTEVIKRDFAMFPNDHLLRHSCADHERETIAFGRRLGLTVGRWQFERIFRSKMFSASRARA